MVRSEFLKLAREKWDERMVAIADTIAHFESNYDENAVRFEDEMRRDTNFFESDNTSIGLFQVLGRYSPLREWRRRQVGVYSVARQFEEFEAFILQPYHRFGQDAWTAFRRYNGSGEAARAYATRAINYMEDNWPDYLAGYQGSQEAGLAQPTEPQGRSPETTGSSSSSPLLVLSLVGLGVVVLGSN